MTNGLQSPPYTADQWPGPPKVLPPMMTNENSERTSMYVKASFDFATLAELDACRCDVEQRFAKALHSKEAPHETDH